jgi:hypothetical protein
LWGQRSNENLWADSLSSKTAFLTMPRGRGFLRRTEWFLVNISPFASDLFRDDYKSGEIGSDLKEIGSAGMNQTRTSWDHSLILAIPFSRWGAVPYIVDPIPFPSGILSSLVSESQNRCESKPARIHPYHQACLWRQEIEKDSQITKAKIAAREGISRARVSQLMNLLELPEEIQGDLHAPPAPLEIYSFSERRLRQVLTCGDRESQLRRWQELVHEYQILVRK